MTAWCRLVTTHPSLLSGENETALGRRDDYDGLSPTKIYTRARTRTRKRVCGGVVTPVIAHKSAVTSRHGYQKPRQQVVTGLANPRRTLATMLLAVAVTAVTSRAHVAPPSAARRSSAATPTLARSACAGEGDRGSARAAAPGNGVSIRSVAAESPGDRDRERSTWAERVGIPCR